MERGLSDTGRMISRDPSHLAQSVLSLVRRFGPEGLPLSRLAQELPAHGGGELDRAMYDLVSRRAIEKTVRHGAIYLVATDAT
ncbi:hypothetical protein [Sphingosinicella sp. CPCC 101087]|uniref:hypothetical protein n=1 Tax=Sphingosinicella sp. CPCC 101087 TaxID=2497754 RepID=UPI00101D6BF7|nr:hypothetical protein [Sphingosinicella sp. CPCC 101087]